MRLLGEAFPLLVQVGPMQFTEESVREMAALYEPYFARGERYATVSLQPRNAKTPGAKERKLIVDWVTSARVAEATKRLCVASATVLPNPIARGVFTAMPGVWSRAAPVRTAGGPCRNKAEQAPRHPGAPPEERQTPGYM